MSNAANEKQLQTWARLAGFLYLLQAVTFLASAFAAGGLMAPHFAGAAKYITAHEQLHRAGLSGVALSSAIIILLAGALYALLKAVSANLALFALLLRTAECVMYGVATVISFVALNLATGALVGFDVASQQALWEVLRNAQAYAISSIYFGFGSSLFFYLLFKSRFMPRALSLFGLLVSLATSGATLVSLILPAYAKLPQTVGIALLAAEVLTGLWLLIAGANFKYWNNKQAQALPQGAAP